MKNLDRKKLDRAITYLRGWLDFNFKDSGLPGLVVAVQHNDRLLLDEAYGYADLTTKTVLTTKSLLGIGSISKVFTATAIMQLAEADKLRLDDKVIEHLTWFESKKDSEIREITIRQILNHTSGLLRDGTDSDYWLLRRDFPSTTELQDFISQAKLTHQINEHFKYSNIGYAYLSLVVESASAQSFSEYITEHVLEKISLTNTKPEFAEFGDKDVANGHTSSFFGPGRSTIKHTNAKGMFSATGFYSTASDLCRFFKAHCDGNLTLLSEMSKREMRHGYRVPDEGNPAYGYGLAGYTNGSDRYFGHSGSFPGFNASAQFEPNNRITVAVITNAWDGPARLINERIIDIINFFQSHEDSKTDVKRFEGRFFSLLGIADIVSVNGQLMETNPKNWGGFGNGSQLTVVNHNTLRIEDKNGFAYSGEEIVYKFGLSGNAETIRYGGMFMAMENEFLKSIDKQFK